MSILSLIADLPNRLARVTSGGRMIKEVDGLRFLAIFPVVIQHLSERYLRNSPVDFIKGSEYEFVTFIASRGFIGVYIFFTISGFILGLPFAEQYLKGGREVSLKKYFWRRLTRLEPPYILVITGVTIFLIVFGYYKTEYILPHFFASIFYVHSIIYQEWTFINPPVWTLEIEVQFYILAPFLAIIFFKTKSLLLRRIILVGGLVIIILLQHYFGILHGPTWLTILGHIQYFLLGFILADIYVNEWRNGIQKKGIYNYISILAFLVLIFSWSWDYLLLNRIIFTSFLVVLFYSVFRATWINKLITLPWITAIGGMCYTIYLIHLPIMEFLIKYTSAVSLTNSYTINFIVQFLLVAPVLMIFSILFFLAVEKPCMHKDWPEQLVNYLRSLKKSDKNH